MRYWRPLHGMFAALLLVLIGAVWIACAPIQFGGQAAYVVADPKGYIFTWLIAYSALLGPIGGILIADYFVWRGRRLNLPALYREDGEYRFKNGFSWVAISALVVGALPSLPGFLVQVGWLSADKVAPGLVNLYNYAWFIGFAIAFATYLAGRKMRPQA